MKREGDMTEEELIVYRDIPENSILSDIVWLMGHYAERESAVKSRRLLFDCMHRLVEQAAMMDGCNRFQCFWKVVFPLMTPINVTQLVLNTLFIWNDYSTSIILLRKKYSFTLTLAQIIYFSKTESKKLPSVISVSFILK